MKKPNMLEEERKKTSVRQRPRSQMNEQLPVDTENSIRGGMRDKIR